MERDVLDTIREGTTSTDELMIFFDDLNDTHLDRLSFLDLIRDSPGRDGARMVATPLGRLVAL